MQLSIPFILSPRVWISQWTEIRTASGRSHLAHSQQKTVAPIPDRWSTGAMGQAWFTRKELEPLLALGGLGVVSSISSCSTTRHIRGGASTPIELGPWSSPVADVRCRGASARRQGPLKTEVVPDITHSSLFTSVAFSPDRPCSAGGRYDVATGRCCAPLRGMPPRLFPRMWSQKPRPHSHCERELTNGTVRLDTR
jgi:hypothetical protein